MEDRFRYKVFNKESKQWQDYIVFTGDGKLCYTDHMICLYEDAYQVCLCSGMRDRNENLIYEGDILKNPDGEIGVVECVLGAFRVRFASDNKLLHLVNRDTEIIGDIFSTPDKIKIGDDFIKY